jgi:DNA-binding NarL/FixJ family response regulator
MMSRTRFTPKEKEILELVTAGLTNKDIGERLIISERTVECHLAEVYRKLSIPDDRHKRVSVAVQYIRGELC